MTSAGLQTSLQWHAPVTTIVTQKNAKGPNGCNNLILVLTMMAEQPQTEQKNSQPSTPMSL